MKTRFFTAVIVLMAALPGACQAVASNSQVEAAYNQADLFSEKTPAFELDADFAIQNGPPVVGSLKLQWAAKDRWRMEISTPTYHSIEVHDGEMEYADRSEPFTPTRIGQLSSLLHFAGLAKGVEVEKQKRQVDGAATEICYVVHPQTVKSAKRTLCVEEGTQHIVKVDQPGMPDKHEVFQLNSYEEAFGIQYPRRLTLFENGSKVVDVSIQTLKSIDFRPEMLTPPAHAVVRRRCEGMHPAMPVTSTMPQLPALLPANGQDVRLPVMLTVERDGTVSAAQVMTPTAPGVEAVLLPALKKWRFQPAMCGTDPIVSDVRIDVASQTIRY